MSHVRTNSSPDLDHSSSSSSIEKPDDLSLEGCTTTLKLLIKLIQDHNEASLRENDGRKASRMTGMINILDEVRGRLQKSQSTYEKSKRRVAELRRCNTDLRPRRTPADLISSDEKSKSKKDLMSSSNMAARKSLEMMCSSLGKEKEIMASELAKKAHELNEMEESINDLKIQNEMLLAKLHACNNDQHKEKRHSCGGAESQQGTAVVQERNKILSEQLLKALDGYRSLKRKLKESQDEKVAVQSTMAELGKEVAAGMDKVRGLKNRLDTREDQPVDIEGEILGLQNVFESLESRISRHVPNKRSSGRKPRR